MAINFPLLKIQTVGRNVVKRIQLAWIMHFKTGDARIDALAKSAVIRIENSTPDMFILRTGIWLLRWGIADTDNTLAFAIRGHIQNRLTECEPATQRLFERIAKHPYPCRLLVSLLYTKRIISDHKLLWIQQTDAEWLKLIEAAVAEPSNVIVKHEF
jgi:hypothetical protein